MGVTKTENYSVMQNDLATIAKAIGHPARIAILQHLLCMDSCICGDLVDVLPLSQATVSQHLKALKEARLIKGNIEGTSVCYCIDPASWKNAQSVLNNLFEAYKGNCGC